MRDDIYSDECDQMEYVPERRSTFNDRYETGWEAHDGTVENVAEYFSKKLDAMRSAQNRFNPKEFSATYVYDRCLHFTRWFDGVQWSREQPKAEGGRS